MTDVDQLCGEVRELTRTYMDGGAGSFQAFRDLVQKLLQVTVLRQGQAVCLAASGSRDIRVLGGRQGPTDPVQLNDDRWLRLSVSLYLDPHEAGTRLKVSKSSYQYQCDADGQQEVFRYDYLRQPGDQHPSAHLNLHAALLQPGVLTDGRTLARVHFPTDRVSLEAVLRLLVQDFGVPAATDRQVWAPVLACSEMEFRKIAHRPSPLGQ